MIQLKVNRVFGSMVSASLKCQSCCK